MAYLVLRQSKVLTRCSQECMGKLPIFTGLPRASVLGSSYAVGYSLIQ
jgi:hypothetical protein